MEDFPWAVLEAIRAFGGRPLLVGGAVRDLVLRHYEPGTCFSPESIKIDHGTDLVGIKDLDFEVYGIRLADLQYVLEKFGQVDLVGKSFGVLKVDRYPGVDFSIPRRDNKVSEGHKGFECELDPGLTFKEAASRRDLTINSLAYDPIEGWLLDEFFGVEDIRYGRLRATDPATFLEDPLRALRVAQFISRLGFQPDPDLIGLCSRADLSQLPGERLFAEFEKLLKGQFPAKGLQFLADTGLLQYFPELGALRGVGQDPEWHPEGDVWTHTCLTVQAARDATDDLTVLWAALCHDFGKPKTTETVYYNATGESRVKSHGHEEAGVEPARALLARLRAPQDLTARVCALVRRHMAPSHFFGLQRDRGEETRVAQAGPGAFRRLARELGLAGTDLRTLEVVSRADCLGRTPHPDSVAKVYRAGDWFLERAAALNVREQGEKDAVTGKHLIAKGLEPGPRFGIILTRCRELQYETGEKDPEVLLRQAGL